MGKRILIVDDEADNIEILVQMLNVSAYEITDLGLEVDDEKHSLDLANYTESSVDRRAKELFDSSHGNPEVTYAPTIEEALAYVKEAQAGGNPYHAIIVDFNLDDIHGEQFINLLLGRIGPMLCGPDADTPDMSGMESFDELVETLEEDVDHVAQDFLENNFESPAELDEFCKSVDENPPYIIIFSGCYTISWTDPEIRSRLDYVQKGPDCESGVLELLVAKDIIDKVPDRRDFKKYIDPDYEQADDSSSETYNDGSHPDGIDIDADDEADIGEDDF